MRRDVLRVRRSNGRSVFLYRQTAGRSHTGGVWLFVRLTRGAALGGTWWRRGNGVAWEGGKSGACGFPGPADW
jgi:hypothetical protein